LSTSTRRISAILLMSIFIRQKAFSGFIATLTQRLCRKR